MRNFKISLILEGEGSLFVAESVVPFKKNEIFLLGKNLPHVFRNKHVKFRWGRSPEIKSCFCFF